MRVAQNIVERAASHIDCEFCIGNIWPNVRYAHPHFALQAGDAFQRTIVLDESAMRYGAYTFAYDLFIFVRSPRHQLFCYNGIMQLDSFESL